MDTAVATELGELAYLEWTLAALVYDSVDRVEDPDVQVRLRAAAERHREHGDRLFEAGGVDPRPVQGDLAEKAGAMERQVEHARGQDGLMVALASVEREEDERFQHVLESHPDPDTDRLLDAEETDHAEDLRVYLDQAPGLAPDIHDPRRSP